MKVQVSPLGSYKLSPPVSLTGADRGQPYVQSKRSSNGQAVLPRVPALCVSRNAAGPTRAFPSTRNHVCEEDVCELHWERSARGFPENHNSQTKTWIRGSSERRLAWYGNSWNFSLSPSSSCICWRVVKTRKISIVSKPTYTHFLCNIFSNIEPSYSNFPKKNNCKENSLLWNESSRELWGWKRLEWKPLCNLSYNRDWRNWLLLIMFISRCLINRFHVVLSSHSWRLYKRPNVKISSFICFGIQTSLKQIILELGWCI